MHNICFGVFVSLFLGLIFAGCGDKNYNYYSSQPTTDPTVEPTTAPTEDPTVEPTTEPTEDPTVEPTSSDPEYEEIELTGLNGPNEFDEDSVLAHLGYIAVYDSVNRMWHLYKNNQKVTDLIIPKTFEKDGTTYKIVGIAAHAFMDCKSLTSVTLPESLTSIGRQAFCGCSSLTSITIPEGVTSIGQSAFSYCDSLASVILPNSVTSIEGSAFWYCSNLSSINFPDNLISIGNGAFWHCKPLTTIVIPNGVTSIGTQVFSNCAITTITWKGIPYSDKTSFNSDISEISGGATVWE
ncbi:MAG: leucine-rich repeat protein [bacterium]|nr:leucine-rich repeat protein [bacterium]